MKTAVILAAGLGSRIGLETPKGFIRIGGQTLIERSLEHLRNVGVTQVLIGTGFGAGYYEDLAERCPLKLRCIKNESFSESGSLFTLFNMRDFIDQDFLLLESDILYERRGLDALLKSDQKNALLASGETNSGDEVFIEADRDHHLIHMSKEKERLGSVTAELVGISRLSIEAFHLLVEWAGPALSRDKKIEYETGIVHLSKKMPVYVHKREDLVWAEIDNEEHLERATRIWNR